MKYNTVNFTVYFHCIMSNCKNKCLTVDPISLLLYNIWQYQSFLWPTFVFFFKNWLHFVFTRWVLQLEQELPTLPGHLISSSFLFCSHWSSFSFLCSVLQIIVCLFVAYHLAIVLFVLLLYTASGNPFGIFTLLF